MRTWNDLIERIGTEVSRRFSRNNHNNQKRCGLLIIKVSMLVDADNRPLYWVVDAKPVEPAADSEDFIKSFIIDAT